MLQSRYRPTNYDRVTYAVAVTDYNYFGVVFCGVTPIDLALSILQLLIGSRYSFRKCKIEVILSVIRFGKSVTMSVLGGVWVTVAD